MLTLFKNGIVIRIIARIAYEITDVKDFFLSVYISFPLVQVINSSSSSLIQLIVCSNVWFSFEEKLVGAYCSRETGEINEG